MALGFAIGQFPTSRFSRGRALQRLLDAPGFYPDVSLVRKMMIGTARTPNAGCE
jgi:hypothetical protein